MLSFKQIFYTCTLICASGLITGCSSTDVNRWYAARGINKLNKGKVAAVISGCQFHYYGKKLGCSSFWFATKRWVASLHLGRANTLSSLGIAFQGTNIADMEYMTVNFVEPGTYKIEHLTSSLLPKKHWFSNDYYWEISKLPISNIEVKGGEVIFIGEFIYDFSKQSLAIAPRDDKANFFVTKLRSLYPDFPINNMKTKLLNFTSKSK